MDNGKNEIAEIPLKTVTKVPVKLLTLDLRNPRLFLFGELTDELSIIAQLYKSEDLAEILQSIAANGYLDIEPLIVLQEGQMVTVLEGNRRLAAIRLFETGDLASEIAKRERVRIAVPPISDDVRNSFQELSVYRVASRAAAKPFIGFKHINGPAKWESYAKASFAAEWYKEEGITLKEIADQIGDRHDTIKRMVNAIYVLEQAEQVGVFHLSDRTNPRFSFSHLYTALSRASYMRFLGLGVAWSRYDPEENPVADERLENLGEVLKWLYGSKEENIRSVIQSQNPDVRHLGDVLASQESLLILRSSGSLKEAHSSAGPEDERFSDSLVHARGSIREAFNNLRGFDGRNKTLFGLAEDILVVAHSLVEQMRKKAEDDEAQ